MFDKRKKYSRYLEGSLWLAILFLGLTIISNLTGMSFVTQTMLGTHRGLLGQMRVIHELHDCTVGLWGAIAGVGFLTMAVFSVTFYKFSEFWALKKVIWKS